MANSTGRIPNHNFVKACKNCKITFPNTSEYYLSNGKGNTRTLCRTCQKQRDNNYRKENIEAARKYAREYKAKIKQKVFSYYSGGDICCSCCSEHRLEFLCIDHINGGGGKHRKKLANNNTTGGGGHTTYLWIIKNNFPNGFRVLCHNCNQSYGLYGYCPHKKEDEMSKSRNITIGVAVIIFNEDKNKMLVTRRRKGLGKGCLSFAGGKIENMESVVNAAVREVKEETGLDVTVRLHKGESDDDEGYTHVLHAEEWFRGKKHQWTIYVVADVTGGVLANPEPDKHEDWQWKTLDELETECGPNDWIPLPALYANMERLGL